MAHGERHGLAVHDLKLQAQDAQADCTMIRAEIEANNVKVKELATVRTGQVSGGSAFQSINRFAVVHLFRAKVES